MNDKDYGKLDIQQILTDWFTTTSFSSEGFVS